MKKRIPSLLAFCGMLACTNASFGASAANDTAEDAAYTAAGQYNGINGGTGFLAWVVTGVAGTAGDGNGYFGTYLGNTGLNGGTINDFGTYAGDAGTGSILNAVRPFSGALVAGQTFSVDLGHTAIDAAGTVGLSLQNSSSTSELTLTADGTNWTLNDGGASTTLAADAINTTFVFTLTYNGGNSYSYTFTGSAGGTNVTATNTLTGLSQVDFFNSEQGANQNLGFNDLAISAAPAGGVPEPRTWVTLVMGGLGALAVARRRMSLAS